MSHISRRIGLVFRETHLGVEENPYTKLRRNIFIGYGVDAIKGKNTRWPTAVIFVDGPEPNFERAQLYYQGNIPDEF